MAKSYKTEIFDLNKQQELPDRHCGAFDVVLDIGTTEHVLNQYNCFEVIHDAAKVNGYIVHQLPISGFTDHGYFIYTGRFFFEMASINKYELFGFWLKGPAGNGYLFTSIWSHEECFSILKQMNNAVPLLLCCVKRKRSRLPRAWT